MVTLQKKVTFCTIYPIRQWLTARRDLTALSVKTLRLNIELKYKKLIENIYLDCRSGGLTL